MKLDSYEMMVVRRALDCYMGGVITDRSTIENHNDPDYGNSAGAVLLADEQRVCEKLIKMLGDGLVEGKE